MTDQVLELATITLAPHSSEEALLAASETFQKEFLNAQDGFLRRETVRTGKRTYLDVILWQSRAHADAVFQQAQSSEVAGQYFSHMQFDPDSMDEGVVFHALMATYSAKA